MAETYLSPSSSAAETDDGNLVCELRDVQSEDGERWKLIAIPFEVLDEADESDALMDDGSILAQAMSDIPSWEEVADIQELIGSTQLSRRQAEFYAWKVQAGLSIREASKEMGISVDNGRGKWHDIKEKIRSAEDHVDKAEKTSGLEIPGECSQ